MPAVFGDNTYFFELVVLAYQTLKQVKKAESNTELIIWKNAYSGMPSHGRAARWFHL